jgi:MoaA/NifB/PqqE/SkfB family radical SAM enzyme
VLSTKRYSKVNIEISNVCNLQCSFCPEVIRDKHLMDLALFGRAIEQVAPLTDQVCFHLMGDPLVHPELEAMLDICHGNGVRVFLVTNGVLLSPARLELLLHPALRQVNFSLHAFADNFGDRDPSEYLNRIFTYTERALTERPDLYVNFRVWDLGSPRGALNGLEDMLSRIEERFSVTIKRNPDVGAHKGRILKNRLYLHFDTEFVWPDLSLPVLGEQGTCYGLTSHFGILADGTVVPCCLDKEGKIALGNLRDLPLLEILEGPRAKALLEGFRKNRLVESLCQRCNYIERFQPKRKTGKRSPNLRPSAFV